MTAKSIPAASPVRVLPGLRRRNVGVIVLGVAAMVAAVGFVWASLERLHRAQREADRVFRALTGTAPVHHQRSGNYLGSDAGPSVEASGPLPSPVTVRSEMAAFALALRRAGYQPNAYASNPRVWCTLADYGAWAPGQPLPAEVGVRCGVQGARADGQHRQARLTLVFDVPPAQLRPTRTKAGYLTVSSEGAVDLRVRSGAVTASG